MTANSWVKPKVIQPIVLSCSQFFIIKMPVGSGFRHMSSQSLYSTDGVNTVPNVKHVQEACVPLPLMLRR